MNNGLRSSNKPGLWAGCFLLLALIATLVFVVPLSKSFPYSDDWIYFPYAAIPGLPDPGWIFSAHNGHRIPVQKLAHFFLLKFSGGDFRPLMALNAIMVSATAYFWVRLGVLFGGKGWRLLFPVALISGLGLGGAAWSFYFQFLSAFFFISLSVLLYVQHVKGMGSYRLSYAVLALVGAAWCGGNGLLGASVVGGGLLIAVFYFRRAEIRRISTACPLLLLFVVIACIGVGGGEGSKLGSGAEVANYVLGMLKAWLGVWLFSDPYHLKVMFAVVVGCVLMVGGWRFSRILISNRTLPGEAHVCVFFVAVQAVVLIAAVAVSRSGVQKWSDGTVTHYGYLVLALPLVSWLSLLPASATPVRRYVLALYVFCAGAIYLSSLSWWVGVVRENNYANLIAANGLLSSQSPAAVSHAHIRSFNWVDGDEAEAYVARGVEALRTMPLWNKSP